MEFPKVSTDFTTTCHAILLSRAGCKWERACSWNEQEYASDSRCRSRNTPSSRGNTSKTKRKNEADGPQIDPRVQVRMTLKTRRRMNPRSVAGCKLIKLGHKWHTWDYSQFLFGDLEEKTVVVPVDATVPAKWQSDPWTEKGRIWKELVFVGCAFKGCFNA